jgi:glycosyltransferase involved in cell wall biosynthesis
MRILFIGKRFYTNRDAYEERFGRIYQLPYWWAAEGQEVDLWLIDYHGRDIAETRHEALTVETTPIRRWRFFKRWISACFSRRSTCRPDVIVASGDCYIGLLGYLIARIRGAKFVFDVYDRYDLFDGYRRFPGFDPQTFLIRKADVVTFASVAVFDELRHLNRSAALVPNGIDLNLFKPLSMPESRRQFDLPDDVPLIGYFGSMEVDRGVSDLIDAVAGLVDQGVSLKLVIAGKANPDINFDYSWVHYLGNLDFKQMPTVLASCSLLALPYRQSEFMDKGASCKIAEYIAVQRPVVATRTQNFVRNFPSQAVELDGLLATPGDATDLGRCIRGQLSERRLVSLPKNVAWRDISQAALASIEAEKAGQ